MKKGIIMRNGFFVVECEDGEVSKHELSREELFGAPILSSKRFPTAKRVIRRRINKKVVKIKEYANKDEFESIDINNFSF